MDKKLAAGKAFLVLSLFLPKIGFAVENQVDSKKIGVSDAQADFENDLSKYVRILDSSFYAFHYVNASALGIAPGHLAESMQEARVKDHFQQWSGNYAIPDGGEVGGSIHAFYTALDPTASSSYGGADGDWLLYRVELPRGLKYLEMEPEPPIPPQILSYLKQQGCDPGVISPVDRPNFNYDNLLQTNWAPKCNKLLINTMRKLGIEAIAYGYDAFPIAGCLAENDPSYLKRAFIVIAPQAIDPAKVQVFWKGTRDDAPEGVEKKFLQAIIFPFGEDAKHRWPSISPDSTPSGFRDWERAHLRNCR